MSAAAHSSWQRLQRLPASLMAALMPDYNRQAALFWWLVTAAGTITLAVALVEVVMLPAIDIAQVLLGTAAAVLAGLFPVRVPGSKNSFVAGEIFIFLLLLMLGPAAAVVAAAGEAAMGSSRTSRRLTSRLFSPAAAALAMGLCGSLLQLTLVAVAQHGWHGPVLLLAALMLFAPSYFLVNALLVAGVPRLKKRESALQLAATLSLFRWVGIAYTGSAAVAGLLFLGWSSGGNGVLVVMLPLVVMVLVSLHFYFRQQEAAEALREAGELAALREATTAAREAEARARHLREMQHLAHHDALTGLPNRRRFMERLAEAVAREETAPGGRPFAVMYIDFDRFKAVNDALGHRAGDELLQQVARRIHDKLRPHDMVARLGGDEFAVLADDIAHERDAIALADRLMEALRAPLQLSSEPSAPPLIASASIGITFSSLGYASADDMLRDADNALYKAKNAGRARYAVFDQTLHAAVSERLQLGGQLREAVANGQLTVDYQPLLELGSQRITGFEALLRWQHPQRGVLRPAQFLAVAEETGLMPQLSDFVLHCACQQLRQWQLLAPTWATLGISVNVSASDVAQRSFVARVGRALVESQLRPQHLTLELSEDVLTAGAAEVLDTLAELRTLGVRLSIDDFGTGPSTLAQLARLPVDSLKIDRSFVARLGRDPGSAGDLAVVRSIVQLGQSLRKEIVAAGIESEQQRELLQELGCTLGQGFHLATPLSAQDAQQWLRARGDTLH